MKSIFVAPHPDDEILGAGGTILRRKAEGGATAWLIVTNISEKNGWSQDKVHKRELEIASIATIMQFDEVYQLNLPAAELDQLPLRYIVEQISNIFTEYRPNEVFFPHNSDIHSDHKVVCQAVASCTKWFRYPWVQRVLSYETLSETDFSLEHSDKFSPNFYVDISPHIEQKLIALKVYASELGMFPFPRSVEAVRALAQLRGSNSGYMAAEAFQLLLERT